ncbi:ribonuclease domain-containing protein [Clostridium sp. ZBS5]|uniref:ribonuclease domain-containing protein n=1 Tax=Clostridium sp. ZBS5 TaxID=2949973 RepID=UPI002079F758|nr:ribonuclease domain-containing protein [Clostridium sp. ZBS5]
MIFWSEADSRGQKAFNSGYDFANWLGCGVPDIVMETLKSNAERSEKAFDSVYDFSNWISFGNVDMVNETFNPKDPLSKEHWLNSFGTASAIFGIKETKGSVPKKSGVGVPEEFGGINKGASNPEAHNVVNYAKLKEEYKVAECANDVVDSLKSTGKLPNDYIPKEDAVNLGWKPNKALNNYAPSKKLGGDIFRNEDGILPNKQGRNWYEADVGMDYTKGRSKNPGYRVVYSNDGLIYGTYNHYETVFKIGEY